MFNSLYVASRSGDPQHGHWGPVARLDRTEQGWRFLYLKGAQTLPAFQPFYEFPDLDKVYESETLFPLFANRLLSSSRPEYEAWLTWGGFDAQDPPDPIALLSVTEGRRVTDPVEVFPCPQPDADGCYINRFFVHGVRWMPEPAREAILKLQPGDRLALLPDRFNPHDRNAVALRPFVGANGELLDDRVGRYLIGYIPRYLAADVCELYEQCDVDFIDVAVVRINRDAPYQQRLLCQMNACWPDGFRPCSTEAFQPVRAEYALQAAEVR